MPQITPLRLDRLRQYRLERRDNARDLVRAHVLAAGSLRDASQDALVQARLRELPVAAAHVEPAVGAAERGVAPPRVGPDAIQAGFDRTERRREASARRGFASKRKRTGFSTRDGQRRLDDGIGDGSNARSRTSTSISMESPGSEVSCTVTATGSGAGPASQRTA